MDLDVDHFLHWTPDIETEKAVELITGLRQKNPDVPVLWTHDVGQGDPARGFSVEKQEQTPECGLIDIEAQCSITDQWIDQLVVQNSWWETFGLAKSHHSGGVEMLCGHISILFAQQVRLSLFLRHRQKDHDPGKYRP